MAHKQCPGTPKAVSKQVDNRYEIEKLTDILQIPEESLEAFIEDLRSYYSACKGLMGLVKVVGDIQNTPVEGIPGKMTWIDDGKHEAKVYIKPAKVNDLPKIDLMPPMTPRNAPKSAPTKALREEISMSFNHTAAYPTKAQYEEGLTIHTRAGKERFLNHLEALITSKVISELEAILFQAREHTITDIEMIMHHSQGKVDFIEAVKTDHILDRISTLKEQEG
jgi:hypothetical protein